MKKYLIVLLFSVKGIVGMEQKVPAIKIMLKYVIDQSKCIIKESEPRPRMHTSRILVPSLSNQYFNFYEVDRFVEGQRVRYSIQEHLKDKEPFFSQCVAQHRIFAR